LPLLVILAAYFDVPNREWMKRFMRYCFMQISDGNECSEIDEETEIYVR